MLRPVGGLLAVVALAGLVTLAPGTAARAEPEDLAAAKAKARQLADQVSALESRVEVAGEQLAQTREQLGQVVQRQISASQELESLSAAAEQSQQVTGERVRALYMGGGQAGLYASVLDGASLADVISRMDAIGRILDHDRVVVDGDQQAVVQAQALQSELTRLTTQQTELDAAARTAESKVQALLTERSQALDQAGAEVRRLTEEWQAQQAAAAAARAAATLGTSGPRPTDLPAPDTPAGVALRAADSVRGVPYVYAGNGPDSFDCSGLTRWAYAKAGVALPRTSREQWFTGPHPSLGELQPGDLLFWAYDVGDPSTIHHVALYVGNGWMIHAPHTGDVVRYARVYLDGYIGATRPTG